MLSHDAVLVLVSRDGRVSEIAPMVELMLLVLLV